MKWKSEIESLREILLDCGLDEVVKWGKPCFTLDGANVAIIQASKEHCSLMFFKGVLLDDTHGLLQEQGRNTQAAMRLQFSDESEIESAVVMSYVKQAIEVEISGEKVAFAAKDDLEIPEELKAVFDRDAQAAEAFGNLTPGRRRSHVLYITDAKQSKTRLSRAEKCVPKILSGKGFNGK